MYAVVQVGAAQFQVSEGDTITVNRVQAEGDKEIPLDKVLMLVDGKDVRVGNPYLTDVKVSAKIIRQSLGAKTVAFKYRKRKDSSTKKGSRSKTTLLNITKISK